MTLPLLERFHGHFGVLAAALLFHPVFLLWRGQPLSRSATWAVSASLGASAVAFALGIVIYGPYRDLVRHDLTLASPDAALLFEAKEHLAWTVLGGSTSAGVGALVAPRSAAGVRRLAARVYLATALTGLLVCVLGVYIASVHSFR